MWGGKGLVQVEMHAVDAEIGRAHPPDDRVEIRAVTIKEGARRMHRRGDLEDLVLEQPAGVRVGQHQRGDVGAELALEHVEIHPSSRISWDRIDGVAASGCCCRVCTMRRFGHENPAAPFAARLEGSADRHYAAELAMRPGTRA